MGTWQDLAKLLEDALAKIDIALVNLLCALGLPGSGKLDVPLCLRTLDDWAKIVGWHTNFARPPYTTWVSDTGVIAVQFRDDRAAEIIFSPATPHDQPFWAWILVYLIDWSVWSK